MSAAGDGSTEPLHNFIESYIFPPKIRTLLLVWFLFLFEISDRGQTHFCCADEHCSMIYPNSPLLRFCFAYLYNCAPFEDTNIVTPYS